MIIYRLHRSVRAAGDYTGAQLAGGRWNPPGTAMLYASRHLSLACLEILVHLDKSELPMEYVWSKANLPNNPEFLGPIDLHSINACRVAGQEWTGALNEVAVLVHSVVIPEEANVLLNPAHRQYGEIVWSNPQAFSFDPRLFAFEPNRD